MIFYGLCFEKKYFSKDIRNDFRHKIRVPTNLVIYFWNCAHIQETKSSFLLHIIHPFLIFILFEHLLEIIYNFTKSKCLSVLISSFLRLQALFAPLLHPAMAKTICNGLLAKIDLCKHQILAWVLQNLMRWCANFVNISMHLFGGVG